MKKILVSLLIIFMIMFVGCSAEVSSDTNPEKEGTAPAIPVCELESVALIDVDKAEEIKCFYDPPSVQDLFKPKYVMAFPRNIIDIFFFPEDLIEPEEEPNYVRFYPFGEILAHGTEGKACYVIFIAEGYQVEQQTNLLQVTPIEDNQPNREPVSMEITQAPNVSVEEMGYKIIENLGRDRRLDSFSLPTEHFPFARIWLLEDLGYRTIANRERIYIRDNMHGGVLIVTISGDSWRTANLRNALLTLEIITDSDNDSTTEDLYPDSSITIQDLFDPRLAVIFMEGTPLLVRHYPFGEIMDADMEGMSSFVIYIENFYQVEQQDNFLRVTPSWDMPQGFPEVFMEIKQVPNITIAEMEYRIKTTFIFDHFYSFHGHYPVDFSVVSLGFYDDTDSMVNDVFIDIYIRDNGNNGVFVVTMQYCHESFTGHGVRFLNSIWTLDVLDDSLS